MSQVRSKLPLRAQITGPVERNNSRYVVMQLSPSQMTYIVLSAYSPVDILASSEDEDEEDESSSEEAKMSSSQKLLRKCLILLVLPPVTGMVDQVWAWTLFCSC
jgi:hypothetical protein